MKYTLTRHLALVALGALALPLFGSAAVTSYSTTPANNNASPPSGAPEGMAPSAVNDTIRQIMADIAVEAQTNQVKTLGSVAGTNTITGNMSPALTGYSTGMIVVFTPANSNTGATTLAINGLSARAVVKFDGDALVSGDLVAGVPALLVASGSQFVLLNPQSATAVSGVAFSDFARLSQSNTFTAAPSFGVGGAPLYMSSVLPVIIWDESDAASSNRRWTAYASGESFALATIADSSGAGSEFIRVERTGTTVDSINLVATSVQANGVAVLTSSSSLNASNLSSGTVPDARVASSSVTQHLTGGLALQLTTRNISGKTGTTKTLSTSAPSGGSDGDVWFRY